MLMIMAQAGGSGFTGLEFVNYGVLGLLVLAMIFDKIVPGPSHQRAVQEADRKDDEIAKLRTEIQELNKYITENVVPALVRATDIQAQLVQQRTNLDAEVVRGPRSQG